MQSTGAGESYEDNAMRELEEEMGIRDAKLKMHFDFFYEDAVSRLWGRLFSCCYDGDIVLDPEEVENGQFMSLQVSYLWNNL
jgi:8-oxo-dGTP pyrophosphatase MutT (NUDIX family)